MAPADTTVGSRPRGGLEPGFRVLFSALFHGASVAKEEKDHSPAAASAVETA